MSFGAFAHYLLCTKLDILTLCPFCSCIWIPCLADKAVCDEHWPKSKSRCITMSSAMTPHVNKQLFTCSTEACIPVQVDNNFTKWMNMCEHYAHKKDYKAELPVRKAKVNNQVVPDPMHDAKYTSPLNGQSKYGTYSEAGLDKFEEFMEMISQRRTEHEEEYKDVEKLFLTNYRAELGIAANTAKEEGNQRRRRKPRKDGAAPKKKRKLTKYDE